MSVPFITASGSRSRISRAPAALDLRLDAEQEGRRALRVEVPDDGAQAVARRPARRG